MVDAGQMCADQAVCGLAHVACDLLPLGLVPVCPGRRLHLVGDHEQTVIHLQTGLPYLQGMQPLDLTQEITQLSQILELGRDNPVTRVYQYQLVGPEQILEAVHV